MNIFNEFEKIAPFLTNPLVLIGLIIICFFGIHKILLKSGIIPPLSKTDAGKIVNKILNFGLIIAIFTISLGFLLYLTYPVPDGYDLKLVIPSAMSNAKILVDDKPAKIINPTLSIITIRVPKKASNQHIVIKKGDITCERTEMISQNNQILTFCQD